MESTGMLRVGCVCVCCFCRWANVCRAAGGVNARVCADWRCVHIQLGGQRAWPESSRHTQESLTALYSCERPRGMVRQPLRSFAHTDTEAAREILNSTNSTEHRTNSVIIRQPIAQCAAKLRCVFALIASHWSTLRCAEESRLSRRDSAVVVRHSRRQLAE